MGVRMVRTFRNPCQLQDKDDPEGIFETKIVAQPVFPPSFPPRPASVQPSLQDSGRSEEAPNQSRVHKAAADGSPSLEEIVRIAHEAGHSDVHLGVGEVPRYRARGDMQGTEWPVTRAEVFQGWLQEILDTSRECEHRCIGDILGADRKDVEVNWKKASEVPRTPPTSPSTPMFPKSYLTNSWTA